MKGRIEKRAPGVYKLIVEVGRDAEGGRHRRSSTVRGTKREAEQELARIVREIDTGAFCDPARMNVGEYLDHWLADYAQHNLTARSYERYESVVNLHLKPAFGQVGLTKLAPAHIQAHYSAALSAGLSPGTVQKHHTVLHSALDRAVRLQMLARNPADAVDLPKARRREMRVLDETATAALLSVAKGTSLYVPVLVAVSTGLRRGELLGLKWQDVDLDGGALSVVRVLAEAGGELTFKEPKTAKSRRLVSLGPTVVDVLRQHRREQVEARLQFGAAFNPEGLVFATADGEPLTPSTFSVAFRRLAGRAGFAGLRLHDLRHTHATQLAGAGVLPKVISERLGHASIGITMDLYAHVMPGMQEDAVARHDAVLAQALAAAESAEAATLGTKMAPIAPFGPQ